MKINSVEEIYATKDWQIKKLYTRVTVFYLTSIEFSWELAIKKAKLMSKSLPIPRKERRMKLGTAGRSTSESVMVVSPVNSEQLLEKHTRKIFSCPHCGTPLPLLVIADAWLTRLGMYRIALKQNLCFWNKY